MILNSLSKCGILVHAVRCCKNKRMFYFLFPSNIFQHLFKQWWNWNGYCWFSKCQDYLDTKRHFSIYFALIRVCLHFILVCHRKWSKTEQSEKIGVTCYWVFFFKFQFEIMIELEWHWLLTILRSRCI